MGHTSIPLLPLRSTIYAFLAVAAFSGAAAPPPTYLSNPTNFSWYGGASLFVSGKGWGVTGSSFDRLPLSAADKVPAKVWELSHQSAGLSIPFATTAKSIQVRWTLQGKDLALPHMPATGVSGVDLYQQNQAGEWRFIGNGRPTATSNSATFSVEADGNNFRLYLPLYNGVQSVEVGVPPAAKFSSNPEPGAAERKPIVFYGTSITQGACASRPGMAATSIVGRHLNWPVINLGFNGSGKMEPALAEFLSQLDPSIYVLDCLWNMEPEMVSQRVEPFISTLRKAHPKTAILLVEDANFQARSPTPKGQILRSVYEKLVKSGVKNLWLLSNEGMLGADAEGTVDGIHPNDLGMMRQAAIFEKALVPILETQ